MDQFPLRQTFELGKLINTAGKSFLNVVKFVKFGCKMLKNVENIVLCSLKILHNFVLRAKSDADFRNSVPEFRDSESKSYNTDLLV